MSESAEPMVIATEPSVDEIAELAKRRGFFFPTAGIYGGTAGFYTWGPVGTALKRHIEGAWRERFALRENNVEIESPTIMAEAVFEASGHLDGFSDMLVTCDTCNGSHRADHLVEEATDIEDAEAIAPEAIAELLAEYNVACPTCTASLAAAPVEEFNLMFSTSIGPGNGEPGYLRPETAQGIFVDFARLAEYGRGQLPLGVTQIGPAYRNEISPRRSVIRVREFTQAELELFVDPEGGDPDLSLVADDVLPLYSIADQRGDGDLTTRTVEDAVDAGIITEPWIAYYLAVSTRWFEQIGLDMDRYRLRQHLSGERAHYASDCWDIEAEVDGNWIELAGIAYRGDYDLENHARATGERLAVFRAYDEPIRTERATVDPDMGYLGPQFGADAPAVAAAIEEQATSDPGSFDGDSVTVTVDGTEHELPTEHTGFGIETVTEAGEHVTPHVVEPSFGVGRIVYTVIDHAYRRDLVDGEERTVLGLVPAVAPYTAAVFPLMDRDGLTEQARAIAADLRTAGVEVTLDDRGQIGRRYRRQDEIGTPYCITVDYETIETTPETVTVRDRDSTGQVRVPIADLVSVIRELRDGTQAFADLEATYPAADAEEA